MIQVSITIKNDRMHSCLLCIFSNGLTDFRRNFLFRTAINYL